MIDVIDNFALQPEIERQLALKLTYGDITSQGHTYNNIAFPPAPDYFLWLDIQKRHKKFVVPVVDFYRINIGSEPVSTWNIHSDINFSDMIAIHYLNLPEQCSGGTKLWRHRETGLLKPVFPVTCAQSELFTRDRNDIEKWELQNFLEMRFNRLAVFNAQFFHSREPRELTNFGDTPETARLVHVFFYNLR